MRLSKISGKTTLLDHLKKLFPEKNRTKLKQFLKQGIIVNQRIVTRHDHPLEPGDQVEFPHRGVFPKNALHRLHFPIVYEDDAIIVVDKPSGLLTVSTEHTKTRTCYHQLTEYVKSKDPDDRIFIVHRLDRDASGLIVFAKNEDAKYALQDQWENFEKLYYAVTEGAPEKDLDTIESYLAKDKFRRVYSTRPSEDSQYAATRYRTLKKSGAYALLQVELLTGRKNQIRVHLADIGHPIIGDTKYGAQTDPAGRLGLHAFSLSLDHPQTGERKTFRSPLPEVLKKALR